MIKHFGPNLSGRDFVCGDIHGCFDLVESFLNKIGFDKTKDRLFSVGIGQILGIGTLLYLILW